MQKQFNAHGEQKQNLEITFLLERMIWTDFISIMMCMPHVILTVKDFCCWNNFQNFSQFILRTY